MTVRRVVVGGEAYLLSVVGLDDTRDVSAVLSMGEQTLAQGYKDAHGDMTLMSGGSLDVLPGTDVAREALSAIRAAIGSDDASLSEGLVQRTLKAALIDSAVGQMVADGGLSSAYIVSEECGAFALDYEAVLDVPMEHRGDLWFEVVQSLRPGIIKGGIAVSGSRVRGSVSSDADAVAVYSPAAAQAVVSAHLGAEAIQLTESARKRPIPLPEEGWDALSSGMKRLLPLRDARQIRAAVLAFRGRGRTVGTVATDRLLRFGVSEWR